MIKLIKRLLKQYETLEREDFLEETGQPEAEFKKERGYMELRNLCVAAAAVLFLLSLILKRFILRAPAYFCGAGAYLFELLMLTEGFSVKIPHREAFMAFCFGPLYLLMGIAYLFE